MSYECGVCEASHHVEHAPDCPHHPNNAGVQPVESAQQNEPTDDELIHNLLRADRRAARADERSPDTGAFLHDRHVREQARDDYLAAYNALLSRLSGGQQSVTLEQVREAFDAQLVVDARIPPEVESAFGAYVTQLRDRVIGWLETAGLSDMERE